MYYNFFNARNFFLSGFILLVSTLMVYPQSNRAIDSLTLILNSADESNHLDVLIALSLEYFDFDHATAYDYANKAFDLAKTKGDSAAIVKSGRLRGQLLRRLDRLNESISALEEIYSIAERNKFTDDYKKILNALAIGYSYKAEYDKALRIHFKSLMIREQEGNKSEISISLHNIGFVYFKLKNHIKALEYFNRSLQLKKEAHDKYDLDFLLINIGLCYNQLKDFPSAQKYFKEAFAVCDMNCADQIKLEGKFGLGTSYYGMQNFEEAINHFKESYEISKKNGNKRFQAENLIYLARIYAKQKENNLAIEVLNETETIASSSAYNEILIDAYKEFSDVFNKLKNYERASYYQGRYINLKDSIYSEELIDNIAKIQTDYAERENIATIAAKEEVIQRQRSLNIAIIIIAILASLLIFVLYRSIQVKKKVNHALSEAKAIIEDQNRQLLNSNFSLDRELKERNVDLQKANESLQRVNEELDNFIYKTSHDIRGPLASLKGMCNVALMDVKDQLALNYLKKLDITAEKLNTILTRLLIVNQINNSALAAEQIDFAGIVDDVLMLEKKKGLPPRLRINKHIDDSIIYHADKEFVRIIFENLIDNAIKFYNDSDRVEPFVDIAVIEDDHQVKIKVVDNGIGISQVHPDKIFQMFSRASERSETGGIGLYITKTATEKLGGAVHLKTTPEGYTEFFVVLPVTASKVLA